MIKIKFTYFLFFLILIYSCESKKNKNWCEIPTKGISVKNVDFKDFLYLNSKKAYLVGSENKEGYDTSVIYSTNDGLNWKKQHHSIGSFDKIIYHNEYVYLIFNSIFKNKAIIYKIDETGKKSAILSFNGFIKDFSFFNNEIYFIARNSINYFLYKKSANHNIRKINLKNKIGADTFIKGGILLFTSQSKKKLKYPNILVKVNLSNSKEQLIKLRNENYFYCFDINADEIFLTAKNKKKDKISVFKLDKNKGELKFLSSIPFLSPIGYPFKMKVKNNEIYIVTKEFSNYIYFSNDFGVSFTKKKTLYPRLELIHFKEYEKKLYAYAFVNNFTIIQTNFCKTTQLPYE